MGSSKEDIEYNGGVPAPLQKPRSSRFKLIGAAMITSLLLYGLYRPVSPVAYLPIAVNNVVSQVQNNLAPTSDSVPTPTAPLVAAASPSVDLGYTTVLPVAGNESWGYYKYQNIRFAAPLTPEIRWSKPKPPIQEYKVNDGWQARQTVDCTWEEDCLFVDVYTPANSIGRKLPVVVWLYGSGYYCCEKTKNPPDGLFDLSSDFIWVSFNSRVGMTGLANGPTFMHQGGVPNVGLWDIEAGFKWVQKYISHFGGDPNRVTAHGYSAGSALALFQITSYGGNAEQLFQQAYIRSPGYSPGAGHSQAEAFWYNVSAAVGCLGGSMDCMRQVPYTELMKTAILVSNCYKYVFEPRLDGEYFSDTPEYQFYTGHFNWTGPMVVSSSYHEIDVQLAPGVETEEDIVSNLKDFFPTISDMAIEEAFSLYPAHEFDSPGRRFSNMRQYFDITSKTVAITNALNNQTWNAKVSLGHQDHGADQKFYEYHTRELHPRPKTSAITDPRPVEPTQCAMPGSKTVPELGYHIREGVSGPAYTPVKPYIARAMQKYLLSFIITGDPNTMWPDEKLFWPRYNTTPLGTEIVMNDTFKIVDEDIWANNKSVFWNKAVWW